MPNDSSMNKSSIIEENELHSQTQAIITRLLQDSLETLSLEEHLEGALLLILSVPWMSLENKGSIHLYKEQSDDMILVAEQNLPETFREKCLRTPLKESLCYKTVLSREMLYSKHHDTKHNYIFEEMENHGHYCIPISLR